MGAAGALAALPSCKGRNDPPGGAGGGGGRIKIGLVVAQAGVYATVGTDMKNGWELWLERHGGKLGNFEVTTVIVDEGETAHAGVPAIHKLLHNVQVDAIVGVVSSPVALGARSIVAEARKLLIVANAGAPTSPARTAIRTSGARHDSPRGPWSFDNQSPKQKIYLRKVEKRGTEYVNTVVADLGEVAPVP